MQLPKSILRGGLIVALLLWLPLSGRAASRAQIHLAADDANRVVLHGNVHPLAQAKFDRGAAPDSLVLNRILLVLKRDAATEKALDAAVEAEHNPASASYHHWLSPAAYHERYGVATQDVTAISNWLTSQGFAGIKLSAGGTILEFSGTAATVRRAFHTQIHTYVVNGQSHWANATDPEIPASLAPAIGGIVSLHNFERKSQRKDIGIFNFDKKTGTWSKASKAVQPAHATGDTVSPNLTTTTSDGSKYYAVGPGDFGTIYNVKPLWDAGTDGTGQQIAIVGRSAITATDVDQFRAAFGLPATKLKIIPDGDLPAHTSAEGESLLDIEWSGAVAKNATINYVVAASTSTTDGIDLAALYAVDNNVAPIVSVSYGMCELGLGTAGNGFYNELWRQAAAEGITVLVATGDGSATTCDQGSNYADWGLTVNGIASTPYNVAVGGTDFNDFGGPNGVKHATYWSDTNDPKTRASALSYIPELVWNDSCANNQITALLGFDSAESLCNSDTSVTDGLENVAGGGGGVSSCTLSTDGDPTTCDGGYDKPAWQNAAGVPDDAKRDIPDLSLFSADGLTSSFYLYCMSSNTPKKTCNYDDSDNLAYMGAGGTSFATPAMAGIVALINQKTNDRQGNANYVFYELARKQFGTTDAPLSSTLSACSSDLGVSVGSTCVFRDVVTGNNAVPCAAGSYNCNVTDANNSLGITSGYTAGVGFDLTTGLGSIDATNLINGWSQAATLTPTVTTVKVSPATGTYGTSFGYTVAVAPKTGKGTPTGTVLLLSDNQSVASATLTSGSATGVFNTVGAGKHAITARYVSDGLYGSSVSDAVSIAVSTASSNTTLALNEVNPLTGTSTTATSIHYGAKVVAKATVSGVTGLASPSGTVKFASSGADSATVALDATGAASATLAQLAVGATESITANYAGDTNYIGSSSTKLSFSVVKATTSVRLASSTTYQVGSGKFTVIATVTSNSLSSNPSGSIELDLNGVKYASQNAVAESDPLTGGAAASASFTVSAADLKSGSNVFTAAYAGDGNYAASTSPALSIGYGATAPVSTLTLGASSAAPTTQQTVALTATVKAGDSAASAGSVVFYDGTTRLGEAEVVRTQANASLAAGTATLYTRLAAGTHAITAQFSGYGVVPAITTPQALSLTVTGTQNATATLTVAANQIHSANYDFTAAVTGYGATAPTGTISINETSTVATLATAQLDPTQAVIHYGDDSILTLDNTVEYLAVGDLNNDGIPDLVLRKAGSTANYLDVYLGKGNGKFADPVEYTVGTASRGHQIAIADLNGDGILDVVTGNQGDDNVSVLLGNGDGTLQAASPVSVGQKGPINLRVTDINHDGIPDVLTISIADSSVSILLGNGDGTFQKPIVSALDTLPEFPAFGDINGDGNLDIVYTSMLDYPSLLHVATGKADGTFQASSATINLTSDAYINTITLGDLNNDGKLDAIVSNIYAGTVLVSFGDGKGGFGTPASYTGGVNQPFISNAIPVDIDGDGKLDLAVLDSVNSSVNILYNSGNGTFGEPQGFFPTLTLPSEIYAADINGDGVPDLLQTSQTHGDTQAVVLYGGRRITTKLRNVAAMGATDQLQQGLAAYSGDSAHVTANSNSVTFYGAGKQATPRILWLPASNTWSVNTPLGTAILDATTYGNIAGTFAYTAQLTGGQAVAITSASQLTAKGTYILAVTFTPADTSSYTTATSTTTLAVSDPDFTFAATGSTKVSLTAGSTATASVSIAALNGFSGYVNLTCTSPAPGVTCTIAPASITPGNTATITFGTTSTTASSQTHRTTARTAGYLAGGAAASLLLFFLVPLRRRRRIFFCMLPVLIAFALATGCGSSSSTPQATTLTLASSSAKIASGGAVTLTATLASNGKQASNRTVTFYDGTTALGSATTTNGVATLNAAGLGVGVHTLTAQFAAAGKLLTSTSNSVAQTVTGKTTATATATFGSVTHTTTFDVTLQ